MSVRGFSGNPELSASSEPTLPDRDFHIVHHKVGDLSSQIRESLSGESEDCFCAEEISFKKRAQKTERRTCGTLSTGIRSVKNTSHTSTDELNKVTPDVR